MEDFEVTREKEPWKASRLIFDEDTNEAGFVIDGLMRAGKEQADLITAAPDLYNALKTFIRANARSCRSCEEMGEAWCSECSINIAKHEAVKALMKADGEATFDDRINPNV